MAETRYRVTVGELAFEARVEERDGRLAVAVQPIGDAADERQTPAAPVDVRFQGPRQIHVLRDGVSLGGLVDLRRGQGTVVVRGVPFAVEVQDERAARLASLAGATGRAAGAATLSAPMPGLVVRLEVEVGAEVQKGQPLVVLQAMKMENELSAPRTGTVKRVEVRAGQTVDHGQVLVVVE